MAKQFLILIGIALLIAIPLSYHMLDNLLQEFVYRIFLSGWIFISAALITLSLTLLTVCAQAIKAAIANPLNAIKTE